MKKLLFTLVATAACGVASAAAENFSSYPKGEFSAATNTVGEVSGSNLGNWTINMSTGPEMLITNKVTDTDDKYLQINTGSTPLWRTFKPVTSVDDATNGVPQATTIDDGTVVSSKVKLTACTEWPELESFWGEKLALFLYAPEDEAAAASHSGGLYAVGGTWITVAGQPVLTNKAYKLAVPQAALDGTTGAITNTSGWAKIDIKAYTNVLSAASSYSGFIVAVNDNLVTVDTNETDYIGLGTRTLSNAADARLKAKELILAAATGQFAGLGFQGEGGIDDVDLAAEEINDMKDQAQMTVSIVGDAELKEVDGGTLDDGKVTFIPGATVTFKVDSTADIVKVTYNGKNKLEYNSDTKVYSVVAEAEATITVSASDAAFQIGDDETGKKYDNLADALDDLKSGDTLKLLSDLSLGDKRLEFNTQHGDVTIDLNGKTISSNDGDAVIYNEGCNITITDSNKNDDGVIQPVSGAYAVWCFVGTVTIKYGTYNGAIFVAAADAEDPAVDENENEASGTATIYGGKFTVKVERATLVGGVWKQVGNYWTIGAATPAPSIKEGDGTIDEDKDGDYVVTPAENVTEVNITVGDYTGNVIVPPTVTKINSTIADEKIGVQFGAYKVVGAFKINADTHMIELNKDAEVKVGDEDIKVEPQLATVAADGETAVDPFVAGDKPAATVKTIPGLKYSLIWDADVGGSFDNVAVEPTQATSSRMTLKDENTNGATKRFYKVMVTK